MIIDRVLASTKSRPGKEVASSPVLAAPALFTPRRASVTPTASPERPNADWYHSPEAAAPLANQRREGNVLEHAAKTGVPFLYAMVELEDGRLIRLTTPYVAGAGHEGMYRWVNNQMMYKYGYQGPGLKRVLGAGEGRAKMVRGKPQITHLNETSGWAHKSVEREKNANKVGSLIPIWSAWEPTLVKKTTKGVPFEPGDISKQHFDAELGQFAKDVEARAKESGIDDNVRHALGAYATAITSSRSGNPTTERDRQILKDAAKAMTLYLRLVEQDGYQWSKSGERAATGGTRFADMRDSLTKLSDGEPLGELEFGSLKTDFMAYWTEVLHASQSPDISVDAVELRGPSRENGIPQPK